MSDKLGNCQGCEWWRQINPSQGECRERSPVVDPQACVGWMNGERLVGPKVFWPETGPHDWCGAHMNKLDEDDAA